MQFEWFLYENVHVAYYLPDASENASCPAQLYQPLCPGADLCDRSQGPAYMNYFDSGDRLGGGGMPAAVSGGVYSATFSDASQAGTYCIGSMGVSGEMKMTLHVQNR